MNNISFYKKFKAFLNYRRSVKAIKSQLQSEFNVRVDNAYRLYTVVNLPKEQLDEPYNLRTSDINMIADRYLKEFSNKMASFLNKNGMMEMYRMYNIEKVTKYSYLVIIGFSLFETDKLFKRILFRILPITLLLSIISFILINYL